MSEERKRILKMLAEGKISQEEADALVAAFEKRAAGDRGPGDKPNEGAPAASEQPQRDKSFVETHPLSPGGSVTLENVNGAIEIRAWDRPEVRVEAEQSARTPEELELIQFTIDPQPDAIAIRVKLPKRPDRRSTIRAAVRFKLSVPADCHLDAIRNVNSDVAIHGVRGRVDASSVNGSVRATGLANDVKLKTVNGSIEADVAAVATGRRLTLETVNGNIDLSLPSDAGLEIHASVLNGKVHCGFPLTVTGGVDKRNLAGTIGDGRAKLSAGTLNGNIRIQENSSFAKAAS